MNAPTAPAFTPARIVALALIGVAVFGLACLRFAPGAPSVSVAPGATAGDLTLRPCNYATEHGSYAADCGTLVVPENRARPGSRLIALPVTRIRARSEHPAEPIFWLEGGPGGTNMTFPAASRFAADRDVVLVGYRGVDGSSVLDCPEVESALAHSTDFLSEQSFRAYGDAFRSCAKRLTADGVDLAGYSTAQRVDDLDAARVALGYGRIDLLSTSAGTRTAMIYAWRYPRSIHRSVMVGVNPPGNFVSDPKTTDEQIGRYAALCAKDDGCRKRTDDLAAAMRRTAAHMPRRWLFLPIKEGNVRIVSFFGFMGSTSATAAQMESAPATLDSWLSAAEGDASGFWFDSIAADLLFPKLFVWGEYAATAVQDAWRADAYYAAGGDQGSILGNPVTDYPWGGGRLGRAWPGSPDDAEYSRARSSTVETLLVSGELDVATPPQVARNELLPYLPNGQDVVLAGFAHTPTFWSEQPEAASRLINTFLDSGQVDDSLYTPVSVDFTPEVTYTAFGKRVAGAMVGLALLAVVSLVWLARRVHRQGGFGRKTSAALRSLSPVVLGPGGWFLGALVVMTALPGVPVDGELATVPPVSLPVGLAIYWAWVPRDRTGAARTAGLLAAVGGALVGAWLGFSATAGLLALATAIAGAALGANLTLILLDIAGARAGRPLLASSPPGNPVPGRGPIRAAVGGRNCRAEAPHAGPGNETVRLGGLASDRS
jgi:pimeloyl-ACP methyl ester carboxylesterase